MLIIMKVKCLGIQIKIQIFASLITIKHFNAHTQKMLIMI